MFSIKESVKFGWEKFKSNLELSLLVTFFVFLVSFLGDENIFGDLFPINLLLFILSLIVGIGYIKVFLRVYEGEKPEFFDLFKSYPLFWKYLAVVILYPLLVAAGIVLIIIPGIFWAVRFSFSQIILIDRNIGPIHAMKESYRLTKGLFWKLLLFWLAIAALNVLGFIVLLVGLLVTVPVSVLASVYVYREICKAKSGLSNEHLESPTLSPEPAA